MENLDKLDSLLRQNLTGIRIVDLARKLGVDRSTVYSWLQSLYHQGRAYYEKGTAYPGSRSTEEKDFSKPSRLNFWAYRKWKRQYEDERLDKIIKELEDECERLIQEICPAEE